MSVDPRLAEAARRHELGELTLNEVRAIAGLPPIPPRESFEQPPVYENVTTEAQRSRGPYR